MVVPDAAVEQKTHIPCTRKCNSQHNCISVSDHSLGSFSISTNSISFKTINSIVARKTLIKKQRIKHTSSKDTFPGAASGNYIQKKVSPE